MDSEAFEIIQFLNKEPKRKPSRKGKEIVNQPRAVEDEIEEGTNIVDLKDFEAVYSRRMELMESKNEKKAKEMLRKAEIADRIRKEVSKQIEAKKETQKHVGTGTKESTEPRITQIRYLVFRNWSGDHLNYNINDNGYKYRFPNGVAALVKHLLEENGFCEGNNEGLIVWNVGVVASSIYQTLGAYHKINHFPKSFEITRKDLMLQNLSKMQSKHGINYKYFPRTFILPAEGVQFMQSVSQHRDKDQWFIVKPHNKSQGKGIWLSNSPEEIMAKNKETVVVSQYLHNPLLVNGLKFDMRIYVGITCINPLRIYVFEDGLARFATTPYTFDLSSKQNLFAHLTNYSLNKYADNFQANDDEDQCKGHKWSLHALREFLTNKGYDVTAIWARIDDLIIKTILSIENTMFSATELGVPYRTNCFEVLGFDILLDDQLRPWLLEVNLSPSLNTDSPLDLKIKGTMLADMFTMIGIVALDQQYAADKSYLLNENRLSAKELKNDYVKLEKIVIRETEEQNARSGNWRRIFPTETAGRYKPFFDIDRPLNRLLRDQELKKFKARNAQINYHQALRALNDNPQLDRRRKD